MSTTIYVSWRIKKNIHLEHDDDDFVFYVPFNIINP